MKFISTWVATFFGVGKIPLAPGTWASLVATFLFYPLLDLRWPYYGAILLFVFFAGAFAGTQYARRLGEVDPSSAVIDEVLGMGVAMFGLSKAHVEYCVMAFILFRLFDIWKPYPIRRVEKLPGGWGIMTDDLVAGLYALAWINIGKILVDYIK